MYGSQVISTYKADCAVILTYCPWNTVTESKFNSESEISDLFCPCVTVEEALSNSCRTR